MRLEAERAKLPEQRRQHEAKIAAERRRLAALEQRTVERLARRRTLEREIAVFEAQEQKYRAQLDQVTNQQQFEAVQHEIAGVQARRSDLETEALTIMDDEERLAADTPVQAETLAKAEREGAAAFATIEQADAGLGAKLAALDARRTEAAAGLPAPARTRYERIRASRAGRAVAAIVKDACGACGRGLSPHALQEARRRDALLTCDGCGRLQMLPPDGAHEGSSGPNAG